MPVLDILDLGKSFGADDIFSGLTASVPHRARIGIVGANGVGKTTLLRILVGEDVPSEGRFHHARGVTIGYLPQESKFESDLKLWDECLLVFEDLIQLERSLNELMEQMALPDADESLVDLYGRRQEEFELRGGYLYETQIKMTLQGLGFFESDYQRPLEQFSGGERTRVLLAKLLMSSPDVLLLDEPTNHLDIAAIEWLESFLRDWDGAALIVSHDRYFLDQAAKIIWEMTPGLEVYRGNYSAYLMQREERYIRRIKEYEAQQRYISKEQDFIVRNIEGQKTNQAKGRRKRLDRLLKESAIAKPIDFSRSKLHIRLDTVGRSGDLVLRTYNMAIGYHDDKKVLFHVPDLVVKRKECVALIGPNGAGKSTFLKTILNKIPPLEGKSQLGSSLQIGYFAQAHEGLITDNTLMDEIDRVRPSFLPAEIRNYLARYLFTDDDVFRKVETLSGGERGRLALAVLALSNANLLLLDEPTNHLDLPSQEILQNVLSDFNGTILLVTHDRYLVDALASQVWEVKTDASDLFVYEGSYSEYKSWLAAQAVLVVEKTKIETVKVARAVGKKAVTREDKVRKKRQYVLELQIADVEASLQALGERLEHPPQNPDELREVMKNYGVEQKKLDTLFEEWAEIAAEESSD